VHSHWQHPAVRVAQDADVGAGGRGGIEHAHAVVRVVLVAVEEVLAVEEDPAALGTQEGNRVAHHCEVLLQRGAQGPLDVPNVGLRDQADHRRP